jgi:hypothetical protein
MLRENVFTVMLARLARVPFALFRQRPFTPPAKALILHPCCLSQVLLSTPLLAALSETYPRGRFDWAVSDWARPAIAGQPAPDGADQRRPRPPARPELARA